MKIGLSLPKLRERHEEVVRHERAHYDAAGELAIGGPVLSDFVTGADGKEYATGGHVMIDCSETGDAIEDLRRGEIIVRAAEAPTEVDSELSDADRNVAAKGRALITKNAQKAEKMRHFGLGQLNFQQRKDMAASLGLASSGSLFNSLA
jgi:hypothetical protein